MQINAQAVEKKTIATLGPGEKMVHGENCLLLDKNPESISFVTVVSGGSAKEYYCYGKDGKKTGPVAKPDASYWDGCQNINLEDCIANHECDMAQMAEYIDYGTGTINFQGEAYGPYGQIMKLCVSDDGQNFYALALDNEMKAKFFDNNNRILTLAGMPEEIIVSPDGTKAFALMRGEINPFDPESMAKIMANPEEFNNPKIKLVGIDGTVYGPFTSDAYNDAWFVPPAKLVVYGNQEVSLDGKLLFKSQEYLSKCDIWVSSNGKDYAWANYENLFFSDGSKYTAPLAIKYISSGGQAMLKWVSLDNEKTLTLYSRPF
jgi:hypothetical protein